jgi:hypothetical protein
MYVCAPIDKVITNGLVGKLNGLMEARTKAFYLTIRPEMSLPLASLLPATPSSM